GVSLRVARRRLVDQGQRGARRFRREALRRRPRAPAGQGLVAVVGNLSDSVYFIDAATLERRGAVAVGHRPYTAVANGSTLYVSNWGDSTLSVIDMSVSPPVSRSAVFVGPHPSALALRDSHLLVALAAANGVTRADLA